MHQEEMSELKRGSTNRKIGPKLALQIWQQLHDSF